MPAQRAIENTLRTVSELGHISGINGSDWNGFQVLKFR